ncbi:probable cardiolipin synthase (CMP-forming) [Trichogramma pretiosum]|uniref:probable cardiolipin synthase (CMP-forming) n=1 Tax=Trichogramma pretiosum TaxID=7493 RepID=UPI0006C9820C|nr:probable cardiolipin synthase (CMP-forming) [Trichogramma pretiosum]
MSYFAVLRLTRCRTLDRCLIERSFRQVVPRLYSVNNDEAYDRKQEIKRLRRVRRKEIKARLIQDFEKTKKRVEEIIERENIWTIPNFLCVGRILSTPWLSYLIVSQDYKVALWLLGFAGLSDLADGWIARTWTSQASKLGSFLDPVADKLLVGTMFLSLTWVGLIPIPLTALVVSRDVALVAGASYVRYRSLPPPKTLARYFDATHATVQLAPTFISKCNTGVQLLLVAGTLAAPVFHFVDHPLLQGLCYLTAITTIAGGASYLFTKNTYKILSKKDSTGRQSCKNN